MNRLYIRGQKTAPLRVRMNNGAASVFRSKKPRALVRLRSPFPRTIPSAVEGLARKASFFSFFCLFFFLGCNRQQEAGSEGIGDIVQETQEQAGQSDVIDVIAEQAESQEPAQEAPAMRNPFLTEEERNFQEETGSSIPLNYLSLSAILYSGQMKKAIIEGRILGEGDSIDNKRIIKIEPEAVTLKDEQGEYIIRLKGVAGE